MHSLKAFVPGAILAMGCALLWQSRSQVAMPLAKPLDTIMPQLAGYAVTEQKISDEERRVAGMSSYIARAYIKDSAIAFTTLVSYYDRQTQGKTIHSPKNCLPGAGWEVVETGRRTVVVDGHRHEVNRYLLRKGSATALAYYWYQGRGRVAADEYAVKWNLLRDAALLGHTEESLVRVVVPVSRGTARADSTAGVISSRLIREVGAVLPLRRA